jgi:hypothetical protein
MEEKMNKSILKFLAPFLLLPLFACGGGSGSAAPHAATEQQVDLTVALQGSGIPGAVDIVVVLPEGFILEVDEDGEPTDTALVELVESAFMMVSYTPETTEDNGRLAIAFINTSGFAEDAAMFKISKIYAAGSAPPSEDDFEVTLMAFDLDGVELPGITANRTLTPAIVP